MSLSGSAAIDPICVFYADFVVGCAVALVLLWVAVRR